MTTSYSAVRQDWISNHIQHTDGCPPSPMVSKHIKMADNPFAFFRGSAQLFYADLQNETIMTPASLREIPLTCITGDCHLANFGFLTEEGSHGDHVIFAPNDFDDACVGFAHWDLMRYLVSVLLAAEYCQGVVAGRYRHEKNHTEKPAIDNALAREAMQQFLAVYIATCRELEQTPGLRQQAIDDIPSGSKLLKAYNKARRRAAGGEEFVTKSALAKAVFMDKDGLRFIRKTDKFTPLAPHFYKEVEHAFAPYMDDDIIDIVQRNNAGTGSVNMARFYFLVGPARPHDATSFSRCHIVEVKQQREAAPLFYFPGLSPVNRLNPAHLTARCQRRMQRRPDVLLDEAIWQEQHYLVRSRHHARVGIKPEDIGIGHKSVSGSFVDYAGMCGKALALAHARSERRSTRFEQAVGAILPDAGDTLVHAAQRYAELVLQDYQTFVETLHEAS